MISMPSAKLRRLWLLFAVCLAVISAATYATAAEKTPRPNILFAMADDWSFGHAGAYGSKWVQTPGFDRVARDGVLFTHAYTPNAKCCPTRSSLLTGRNSWQLKDAANHICFFPPKFTIYTDVLAAHGYFVGFTGKGWGPGTALDADGKPRQMTGRPFNARKDKPPAGGISGNDYAGNFADFLKAAPQDTPWCFWYGATEPHRGYELGVGAAKAGKKTSDIEHVPAFWPDNETIRNDMLDYAFEVEHFDRHLARMLDQLQAAGQLENTLVVVTSDHGMPFPRCKGQAYDYSNHVPLAIMWPAGAKKPGRVVDDYVSFIDLAPTYIELAGLTWEQTDLAPSPGRSLTDILRSEASGRVNPQRDHVLVGKERHDIGRPHDWGYPIRGIFKNDMLYIHNFETSRWPAGDPVTGYLNCDGGPTKTEVLTAHRHDPSNKFWRLCFGKRPAEEMFDVRSDPDCIVNLADNPQHEAAKEKLKQQLFAELRDQDDPRMRGEGDVFDKAVYSNPGTRNFYDRYMRGEKIRAGWVNASDFEKRDEQP